MRQNTDRRKLFASFFLSVLLFQRNAVKRADLLRTPYLNDVMPEAQAPLSSRNTSLETDSRSNFHSACRRRMPLKV
ncbi:hypothetical protein DXB08_28465 [Hungatella hathewayi]|uniref:Uncharacterized protein n=1 Tax=Hungatella hathewayi TaxID=154046 RepID=A0A3E4TUC4_9FIRM|nr:hypothetical protein DXC39_27915 [Hungatella hathewayi]RGO66073.1 hypothetical protein DXB08_28465 [Hungatella hathewayi]RHM82622.1 hypothetical protein DWZ48_04925 [Hungatella hathewayi]